MTVWRDARGNEYRGFLDGITNVTVTDARAATASLAALNAEAVVDMDGVAVVMVDIRGTFVGTFVFEASVDGTNYVGISGINVLTQQVVASITATATTVAVGVTGFRRFRVRCSAFTSGAGVVALRATAADYAIITVPLPALLSVTNTAIVNTAVTLTVPAAGAGLFHYFTRIMVQRFFATAGLAGATPTLVTTTNLPGARAFSFPTAGALGTSVAEILEQSQPLKSSAANTATTIVCPASTDTIWRVTADYYVGA
jgi:hypothetical protein